MEGRPPGPLFAHQRWEEFYPVGYLMSIGQCQAGTRLREMPEQNQMPCGRSDLGAGNGRIARRADRLWRALPVRRAAASLFVTQIYNDLPTDRAANGEFGRLRCRRISTMRIMAPSDGACCFIFPELSDYHWSTALARRDMPSVWLTSDRTARKASVLTTAMASFPLPEIFAFRELWLHDHRFFFTAENVPRASSRCAITTAVGSRKRRADRNNVNLSA